MVGGYKPYLQKFFPVITSVAATGPPAGSLPLRDSPAPLPAAGPAATPPPGPPDSGTPGRGGTPDAPHEPPVPALPPDPPWRPPAGHTAPDRWAMRLMGLPKPSAPITSTVACRSSGSTGSQSAWALKGRPADPSASTSTKSAMVSQPSMAGAVSFPCSAGIPAQAMPRRRSSSRSVPPPCRPQVRRRPYLATFLVRFVKGL